MQLTIRHWSKLRQAARVQIFALQGYMHGFVGLRFGRGLLGKSIISLGALSALVLTHLHFDHVSDAFDLAVAMEASGNACPPVFAPETPAPQRALLPAGARFAREFAVGPFSFCLYPARHPVEAYSLVIRCETAKFVFTGDTNWHDGLIEMCRDADLLLADSAFFHAEWSTEKPHLSARSGCAVETPEEEAGAKALCSPHSARQGYCGALEMEAQAEFPPCARGQTGRKLWHSMLRKFCAAVAFPRLRSR